MYVAPLKNRGQLKFWQPKFCFKHVNDFYKNRNLKLLESKSILKGIDSF